MMIIKIYKANDREPPYKIIGGYSFYIYSNEIKKIFIYSNSNDKTSMFNCKCEQIIITYQPDEVLVYESWDDSKDKYGDKFVEYEEKQISKKEIE